MAVYTEIGLEDAGKLADRLGLGRVIELRGIPSGIENTNYYLTCERGEFVLTIFERLDTERIAFCLQLMKHLASRGIPVPEPQSEMAGQLSFELRGKLAAVVTKLRGQPILAPTATHCEQVGAMLARMHLAAQDFPRTQPHPRGLDWCLATAPEVEPFLDDSQRALLEKELAFQRLKDYRSLPHGPIHADLFRDNVLFDGDCLSGFFDFYFAGVGPLIFDLAVCLNDWCWRDGALNEPVAQWFLKAYDSVRPLTESEQNAIAAMRRAAALRFWLSRLRDLHLPRPAALLTPHDPAHFARILRSIGNRG